MSPSTTLRPTLSVVLCMTLAGCGFAHVNTDRSSRPDRALGTGAAVIMPGQAPPPLESYDPYGSNGPDGSSSSSSSNSNTPPPNHASTTQAPPARTGNVPLGGGGTQTYGSGPGSQSGSATGPEAGRGRVDPEMTMIGGQTGQSDQEYTLRDAPLGPLAILFGYPWWVLGKTLPQEADQAVDDRKLPTAEPDLPKPTHPADARQRVLQDRENAELARQLEQASSQRPEAFVDTSRGSAIGEELAALERSLGRGQASKVTGPRETVDRNADGRPDLWSKAAADGTSRESIDDDHDGRADRILYYDSERRLMRSEEDLDGDGRMETQSQYANGEVARRRADANGDGQIDTWTYYRGGELVRHEVDRDGDGFRDLSSVYSVGELVREEEDTNADGNADRVSYYRGGEIVERTEDTDFDGDTDVRSFYTDGKLVKREVG